MQSPITSSFSVLRAWFMQTRNASDSKCTAFTAIIWSVVQQFVFSDLFACLSLYGTSTSAKRMRCIQFLPTGNGRGKRIYGGRGGTCCVVFGKPTWPVKMSIFDFMNGILLHDGNSWYHHKKKHSEKSNSSYQFFLFRLVKSEFFNSVKYQNKLPFKCSL